jgi:tripartite-type tricarboxylate transporter receptor subunit TctC
MASTIQAGMVRALATSGKQRSPTLPDVPTFAEAGVPGFRATLWVGLMAPAGTPQPIVEKLNHEITTIVQRPDIKAAWEKLGASPLVMTQQQFTAFMNAEVAKWAKVIAANHITPVN